MNLIKQRELEIEEVMKGCNFCAKINGKVKHYCQYCSGKLQTLKKILKEEKEFVKRVKELGAKKHKYTPKSFLEEIDNISIHNPQTKQGILRDNGVGEKSSLSRTNKTVDNEPENVSLNNSSGSSKKCKNCGHYEDAHNKFYGNECNVITQNGKCFCSKFEPQGERA